MCHASALLQWFGCGRFFSSDIRCNDTVFTTWLHLCAIPWIYNTRFVIGVAETIDSNGFFTSCLSISSLWIYIYILTYESMCLCVSLSTSIFMQKWEFILGVVAHFGHCNRPCAQCSCSEHDTAFHKVVWWILNRSLSTQHISYDIQIQVNMFTHTSTHATCM